MGSSLHRGRSKASQSLLHSFHKRRVCSSSKDTDREDGGLFYGSSVCSFLMYLFSLSVLCLTLPLYLLSLSVCSPSFCAFFLFLFSLPFFERPVLRLLTYASYIFLFLKNPVGSVLFSRSFSILSLPTQLTFHSHVWSSCLSWYYSVLWERRRSKERRRRRDWWCWWCSLSFLPSFHARDDTSTSLELDSGLAHDLEQDWRRRGVKW